MPAKRVSMRRIREILRLKHACGAPDRAIARSVGVARSTIALYLERAAAAGLSWPLPDTLTDRVFPPPRPTWIGTHGRHHVGIPCHWALNSP